MKVTSPVGDFPFSVENARVKGGRVVLDGHMGAWPAKVEWGADDLPALVSVFRKPLLALGAAALLGAWLMAGREARRCDGPPE